MPYKDSARTGSPCWADLWTSDTEGSRSFYSHVFGWRAEEPSPEYGGYFMFSKDGVPTAGGMGDMGDMRANDTWKIYLATDDIAKKVEGAEGEGAQVVVPPTPVADLGTQAVLVDPTGATVGVWEPGTFPGFSVLGEQGAPSWFELHTRDYSGAVSFYRSVFGWDSVTVSDNEQMRYTVMRDPLGEGDLAGIMDASGFLPEGSGSFWFVYWEVDDQDGTISTVEVLGGSVLIAPQDTPHGRLATVADPCGAQFKLRTTNP
jgi:uncharacterized protein